LFFKKFEGGVVVKKLIIFVFSVFVILVVGKPFLKGRRGGSSFLGGFAGGTLGGVIGPGLASKSSSGGGVRYRDLRDLEDWCRKNMERIHDRLDDMHYRLVVIEDKLGIPRARRENMRVK
jgi:hypothetical protein